MALTGIVALASILVAGAAAEGAPRLGITPVQAEENLRADQAEQVEQRLMERYGEFSPLLVEGAAACADAACWQGASEQAGVSVMVQVEMVAESRDYLLRSKLVDGRTGEVIRADESACEICTFEEALEQLDQDLANLKDPIQEAMNRPEEAATATLHVVSRPSDAIVRVDGEVVGSTPYAGPVPAGEHEITVQQEGYADKVDLVEFVEGEDHALEFKLARDRGKRGLQPIIGWAAIGVSVPLLVTGITLLALDENPHKGSCNGDSVDSDGTCEFRYNTLGGGIITLVTGLAAAGAGATLIILDKKNSKGKSEGPQASAWIGPGGVGVRGRF